MDYAQKNSSLSWFDYMWCRALKHFKGENYQSLESADMAYLLKLNEYLDIEDYINDVSEKDQESSSKNGKNRRKG